ncbi:MAG TPA: hypothetical protein VF975_05845 [Thermoanaerobaculia bacterium]
MQRPPTRKYWNRGWQLFFAPKYLVRDRTRGLTHWLSRRPRRCSATLGDVAPPSAM